MQKFLQNLEKKIPLKVFTQLSGMEEKHFQNIELRKNKMILCRFGTFLRQSPYRFA